MIFFLLLTPLPARAEITVTIINGSPLEINYLYLESGEGGLLDESCPRKQDQYE